MSRLRRHLVALGFLDEFGPLFALYTLLFDDHGLTTGQVSTVFALWAAVAVVLEVPSGALADRVDRRLVIASGLVVRAAGIATWLVWPSFTAVLIGAGLWALHGALLSGAWEAMVYDELAHHGDVEGYPAVRARQEQASSVGIALSGLLAAGLTSVGVTMMGIGWITVALHAVPFGLVLALPRVPRAADEDDEDGGALGGWWATLVLGVRTAVRSPRIGRLVLLGGVLEGSFDFDEYVPLVARHRGADDALVPLLVVVVWAGLVVGGEIAARRASLSPGRLGLLLGVGAASMFAAMRVDHVAAIVGVGVAYATMEVVWILTEARTQELVPPKVRATVASVRGLLSASIAMGFFWVVAAVGGDGDPSPTLAALTPLLALAAVLTARWTPPAELSRTRA